MSARPLPFLERSCPRGGLTLPKRSGSAIEQNINTSGRHVADLEMIIMQKKSQNGSILKTPMDCKTDKDAELFVASLNHKDCRNWLLAIALLFARGKLRY